MSDDSDRPHPMWPSNELTPPFGSALPRPEDVPAQVVALRMHMIAVEGMLRDQIRERKRHALEHEKHEALHAAQLKAQQDNAKATRQGFLGIVATILLATLVAALTVGGYREKVDTHTEELRAVKVQLREIEKSSRPWSYDRRMSREETSQ